MLNWRRWGPSAKYEHNVHSAIYETYLVSWFSRDLCSIGGGGGPSAKCEHNVHSAIYETYLV